MKPDKIKQVLKIRRYEIFCFELRVTLSSGPVGTGLDSSVLSLTFEKVQTAVRNRVAAVGVYRRRQLAAC